MKRILKRIVVGALAVVLVLFALVLFRALTFSSMQITVAPQPLPEVNIERAAATLQLAIRHKTVSLEEGGSTDPGEFLAFHRTLEERFPLVHEQLEKELVSDLSLLYTWRGSNPEQKAMLLLAHQDVVPTPDLEDWTHPPFSGELADGYVWGRGALDDKCSLIGILEAVETLLESGFAPTRTIHLCFGHDEEIGGWDGAAAIAALLAQRGVTAEFSLDEGMVVVDGAMIGVDNRIAFVAVTEKGYVSLALTAQGEPGHASTPPRETTLGILAKAVARLEDNPMPASLTDPVRLMFRYLAPEMSLPMRMIFANLWLTEPLVLRQMAGARVTDAAIRTTTAVTILEGGYKDNVLPPTGRAVVNFRPKPGDTIEMVKAHVRAAIDDDRIEISEVRRPVESPAMARLDVPAFTNLHETIRQVFPDALVAPNMMLGGTDSQHYAAITENIYNFLPIHLTEEALDGIHGPNERIHVEAFERMIAFYMLFIEKNAG